MSVMDQNTMSRVVEQIIIVEFYCALSLEKIEKISLLQIDRRLEIYAIISVIQDGNCLIRRYEKNILTEILNCNAAVRIESQRLIEGVLRILLRGIAANCNMLFLMIEAHAKAR